MERQCRACLGGLLCWTALWVLPAGAAFPEAFGSAIPPQMCTSARLLEAR